MATNETEVGAAFIMTSVATTTTMNSNYAKFTVSSSVAASNATNSNSNELEEKVKKKSAEEIQAAANVQKPMLADPNEGTQAAATISTTSVATSRAPLATITTEATSANRTARGELEEKNDSDNDGGDYEVNDNDDGEQQRSQEEREVALVGGEAQEFVAENTDQLSRRLFGADKLVLNSSLLADELRRLRNHKAKLFANSPLNRRRRRRRKRAKAKKSKNKKRALKTTQTRQSSTTAGYDSLVGGIDLVSQPITESPKSSQLRQHFPSLANPLQLPSAVQRLFASKLSPQLRGQQQQRNRYQQQQQQHLASLMSSQQQEQMLPSSLLQLQQAETRSPTRLSELLGSMPWTDSGAESSSAIASLASASGAGSQHDQRDKLIPVEIIGLDPAVSSSILEGATDPSQMYAQGSADEHSPSSNFRINHHNHHIHHNHHHHHQDSVHSTSVKSPSQQNQLGRPRAPSIIHIHHFHTQSDQNSAASQAQQQQQQSGSDEQKQHEANVVGDSNESSVQQQRGPLLTEGAQQQVLVNNKEELVYLQMEEQSGGNNSRAPSSAEQPAAGATLNNKGQQQQHVIVEQQELQTQQEYLSGQEPSSSQGEQQQQQLIGGSVGLASGANLAQQVAANSTRNEANSTGLHQTTYSPSARDHHHQQQHVASGDFGQNSIALIGRVSSARGIGADQAAVTLTTPSEDDIAQQQMLMVAYKPQQQAKNSTVHYLGHYLPPQQQQQQERRHQVSPFNEGQESMSSHSLALAAKQLSASGQQLVRSPFSGGQAATALGEQRPGSELLFEQLSPAELAMLGLSHEAGLSDEIGPKFGPKLGLNQFQESRVPFGANSSKAAQRPPQSVLNLDQQLNGAAGRQTIAGESNAGHQIWLSSATIDEKLLRAPDYGGKFANMSTNNLFGGQQSHHHHQQQNLIGNLALLRQLQQANVENNGSSLSSNEEPLPIRNTISNNSTKLTNEELLALLHELKLSAGSGQQTNGKQPANLARPLAESVESAVAFGRPAAKFELAQASNQLPPRYLKSQLISANNTATHNGYQQQQQRHKQQKVPNSNKDHKSSGAHLLAEQATQQQQQSQRQLSGQLSLNKQQQLRHNQVQLGSVGAATDAAAAGEQQQLVDDANGLSTICLAFIFAVSLLTLAIIAASMIYRHRRRSVGRCADLAGRSRLNLTQRTKHFMRSNFVSPSDVTSIKSVSTEVAPATPPKGAASSAAVTTTTAKVAANQPSFIGVRSHEAGNRYTSTKQSFAGQTMSTFSGTSSTDTKYQFAGESGADIKTLNTRLQKPSYLRSLISSQESLLASSGQRPAAQTLAQATHNSTQTAPDATTSGACYLNIRHRSANLLQPTKQLGRTARSSENAGEGGSVCMRSHSFQRLNCDPSQKHRSSLKGPHLTNSVHKHSAELARQNPNRMATIYSVDNCDDTLNGVHCRSPSQLVGATSRSSKQQSVNSACYRLAATLTSSSNNNSSAPAQKHSSANNNTDFAQIDRL